MEMASREKNVKYRVVVAMGTCGIAAGARNVMSALVDEIGTRSLKNTVITQTGCLGYCDQEPLVQVFEQGRPCITYGKVTPEVARKIVADHIVGNKVLSDYVFKQN
ncbi:(2Fe-2S) ferredoxin domain-containing protein [candidate division KSB1 bacterium]|nr:(2Fe-2S) ferredoxin domain-containing protein [candidate division KSB1 bacterium]